MPKPGGVALGGLIRLYGDVGAVAGDAEHSVGDGHAFLHSLLAQFLGDGPVGPLVSAAVCGPVVDHVDGLGGIHAAVTAVGGGVLDLDRENLVGLKSVGAVVLIAVCGWDCKQSFCGQVNHHGRQYQQHKTSDKTDGSNLLHMRFLPSQF